MFNETCYLKVMQVILTVKGNIFGTRILGRVGRHSISVSRAF